MVAQKTRTTFPNLKVNIERLADDAQVPWMQVTFSTYYIYHKVTAVI